MVIYCFLYHFKGSAEELIKQELQAVAEGVAASVFQSATNSNPDLVVHEKDESAYESNQEREAQDSDIEMKHKAKVEVLNLIFHTPCVCLVLVTSLVFLLVYLLCCLLLINYVNVCLTVFSFCSFNSGYEE